MEEVCTKPSVAQENNLLAKGAKTGQEFKFALKEEGRLSFVGGGWGDRTQ